eukprot:COSAG05_NODE_1408_length_4964_cov_3.612950_1_plen_362_part_00
MHALLAQRAAGFVLHARDAPPRTGEEEEFQCGAKVRGERSTTYLLVGQLARAWATHNVGGKQQQQMSTSSSGRGRQRGRSPSPSSSSPPQHRRRSASPRPPSPPRRFAKYDRVWCNLGGDIGWVSGNVQATDEPAPDESGVLLPYVVMLDKPHKRLISVPFDRNGCVRADVCFEAWPYAPDGAWAQPFAQAAARKAPLKRPKLRFEVGTRVACLTAGPDGLDWPRRWSAGTIQEHWHHQAGAPDGSAVPYAVALDSIVADGHITNQSPQQQQKQKQKIVLVHQDEHQYVRALQHQPAGQCPSGIALARFTTRPSDELGWVEKVDQQTQRVRKAREKNVESDEDDSFCDGFVARSGGPSDTI